MNYLKAIAVSVTRQAFQYLVTEHIAVVVVCSIRKKRKYLWKAMIYKYTSNEEKQKKEIEREREIEDLSCFLFFYFIKSEKKTSSYMNYGCSCVIILTYRLALN